MCPNMDNMSPNMGTEAPIWGIFGASLSTAWGLNFLCPKISIWVQQEIVCAQICAEVCNLVASVIFVGTNSRFFGFSSHGHWLAALTGHYVVPICGYDKRVVPSATFLPRLLLQFSISKTTHNKILSFRHKYHSLGRLKTITNNE